MEIGKMQEQVWKSMIAVVEVWPFSGTKQQDVIWYKSLVQSNVVLNGESSYKPEGVVKKLKSMQNSMQVAKKKHLIRVTAGLNTPEQK